MDEPADWRRVSHSLEDSDSETCHRAGCENAARIPRTDRQNKTCAQLLGRRHCSHWSAQLAATQRHRLSGDDRLRPPRATRTVTEIRSQPRNGSIPLNKVAPPATFQLATP